MITILVILHWANRNSPFLSNISANIPIRGIIVFKLKPYEWYILITHGTLIGEF